MNLLQIKAKAGLRLLELEEEHRLYRENIKKFKLTESQRENFLNFVLYTKPDYRLNWHHEFLCSKLNDFAHQKIKNLMVFMPPQHGKSELVSRKLPAYMLGLNPNLKFIGASYAAELSKSFNRDCQKVMKSQRYEEIFKLSENKDVSGFRYAERSDYFEIEGYSGYYKSVGVEGGISGFPADVFSIDDPVKDYADAASPTERNNKWRFYTDVVLPRCKSHTQKLLTMTRWNDDDLAGRIIRADINRLARKALALGLIDYELNADKLGHDQLYEVYQQFCDMFPDDTEKWEIVIFPAIKTNNDNPNDPRQIGEALWEEEKSLELLLAEKATSPRTFVSLYQQRPAPEEGDIIKKAWFQRFDYKDLPADIVRHFRSDTAYGKEKSDNSSTLCYSIHNENLYIWNNMSVNLPYPEWKKAHITFLETNNYTQSSKDIFEPKATGITVVQDLKEGRLTNGKKINVIEDIPPKDSKETRVMSVSPIIEAGRVFLLNGAPWIEAFLLQCAIFPNGKHDDDIDNLAGILIREFLNKEAEANIRWLGLNKN